MQRQIAAESREFHYLRTKRIYENSTDPYVAAAKLINSSFLRRDKAKTRKIRKMAALAYSYGMSMPKFKIQDRYK